MSIFFSYIFLGLSLSAPMGPINAAQLDKGIRYGFWHSWLVGVGGMGADAIFMLAIYFGLALFIDTPIIHRSCGCRVRSSRPSRVLKVLRNPMN